MVACLFFITRFKVQWLKFFKSNLEVVLNGFIVIMQVSLATTFDWRTPSCEKYHHKGQIFNLRILEASYFAPYYVLAKFL